MFQNFYTDLLGLPIVSTTVVLETCRFVALICLQFYTDKRIPVTLNVLPGLDMIIFSNCFQY